MISVASFFLLSFFIMNFILWENDIRAQIVIEKIEEILENNKEEKEKQYIQNILTIIESNKKNPINYFDDERGDINILYEVWDILDEKFLDTRENVTKITTNQERIYSAIAGLTASFEDPYTVFLPPQESKDLQEDISGEFGGIGVEIENRSGLLTVVSPLSGTPAANAGLMPKDIIVEIDGEKSTDFSPSAAAKLIRGNPGTFVELTIIRKGEIEPLKIKIKRALIEIPIVKTYNKDGVFVIKLFSFTENSPELFFNAIKEFAKTKNTRLIIDLRGNPGGHLFAAVYISGLFLPEGVEILTEDYGDKKEKEVLLSGKYHKSNKTVNIFSQNVKIGVLVDQGSASAAEILAGSLNDNNRAIILGKNTYGKGTVQQVKDFKGTGTSLKYTIARWILPNGQWITNKGIPVDIEIDITKEEIKKSRENGSFSEEIDGQLLKAIEQMKKVKTQDDILDIIETSRKDRQKKVTDERGEKIKNILNN